MKASKIIDSVINSLRANITGLEAVYLFGSQSDNTASPGRDWDFAFLTRSKIEATERWKLKSTIETSLNISMDLIDLHQSDTVTQFNVVKTGKCIWFKDQLTLDEFESMTISLYQKLNLERAGIIEEIDRRGSVYG